MTELELLNDRETKKIHLQIALMTRANARPTYRTKVHKPLMLRCWKLPQYHPRHHLG